MKYTLAFILLLLFKFTMAFDIIDEVSDSFKNGDAKKISSYFPSTIELSILGQEDIYSASQASLILKDFFAKHPPIGSKVIHKVVSKPNFKFGVIILDTSKGSFRINFELKSVGEEFNITQIRIEENKE